MAKDDIYDKIVEQLRYDLTAEEYKELIGLEYTSSQGFATDEEIERYKFLSNKRNPPYFREIKPEDIWNEEKKEGIKKVILEHTLEESARKEGLYRASQNNMNQAEAGYNAKWFVRGALWQAERMREEILKYNKWFHTHCMYYDGWNIRVPLGDKYPEVYTEEEIYDIYLKEQNELA
jgi:hypothetical protein